MLNEEQQKFARGVIKSAFDNGVKLRIDFKKLDGSDRSLIATPFSQIPEEKLPKEEWPVDPEGAVIRIFSEVEQDWRSLRIENIEHIEVLL